MNMDHVGPDGAEGGGQATTAGLAPDHLRGDERPADQRPPGDLVVAPLESLDGVTRTAQSGELLIDHPVLSAGRGRPVAIVDEQDPHSAPFVNARRRSREFVAARSEAATVAWSR